MTATTKLEKEIVLKLFKEFIVDYNSNTISKEVHKSRIAAFKSLKKLEKENIVKGKTMGKARFYSIDFNNEYALKNVETLLMEEAISYKRWTEEFNELSKHAHVIVLFGSFVKNQETANDIDLLIILNEKNAKDAKKIIKEKNQVLIKRIHPLFQTEGDFNANVRKHDKVILNAVKHGIVLYGYEKYLEMIKDAAIRQ